MSRGMKVGLIIGVLALAGGGGIAYSMNKKKNAGTEVRMEQVSRRDLVDTARLVREILASVAGG